jgi:hypothetical protein
MRIIKETEMGGACNTHGMDGNKRGSVCVT